MPDELKRAEKADLVTFSDEVEDGVKCANCMYVDVPNNWCLHKLVDQELKDGPERMCCSYWDGVGTIRVWEEEPRTIEQRDKYIKKEGSTMPNNLIEEFQKEAKSMDRDSNSVEEFKLWLEAHEGPGEEEEELEESDEQKVVEDTVKFYDQFIQRAHLSWDDEDLMNYVLGDLEDEFGTSRENIDIKHVKELIEHALSELSGKEKGIEGSKEAKEEKESAEEENAVSEGVEMEREMEEELKEDEPAGAKQSVDEIVEDGIARWEIGEVSLVSLYKEVKKEYPAILDDIVEAVLKRVDQRVETLTEHVEEEEKEEKEKEE